MNFADFLTVIGLCGVSFIVGRMTYTPESWNEAKAREIEKKVFNDLRDFFIEKLANVKNLIREEVLTEMQDVMKRAFEQIGVNVKNYSGAKEDVLRQLYKDCKGMGWSDEKIKEKVMSLTKIPEDEYERTIRNN